MARAKRTKSTNSSDIEVIIAVGVIIFIFALVGLMNGNALKENFYKTSSPQPVMQTENTQESAVGATIQATGSVVALKPAVSDFQVAP